MSCTKKESSCVNNRKSSESYLLWIQGFRLQPSTCPQLDSLPGFRSRVTIEDRNTRLDKRLLFSQTNVAGVGIAVKSKQKT